MSKKTMGEIFGETQKNAREQNRLEIIGKFRDRVKIGDLLNVKKIVKARRTNKKYQHVTLDELVNSCDENEKTPLFLAAERQGKKVYATEQKDKTEVINWLSMHGADFSATDREGRKAYEIGAPAKISKLIKCLDISQRAIRAAHKIFTSDVNQNPQLSLKITEMAHGLQTEYLTNKQLLMTELTEQLLITHPEFNKRTAYVVARQFLVAHIEPFSLLTSCYKNNCYQKRCQTMNTFVEAILFLALREETHHIHRVEIYNRPFHLVNHQCILMNIDQPAGRDAITRALGEDIDTLYIDAFDFSKNDICDKRLLTKYASSDDTIEKIKQNQTTAHHNYQVDLVNMLTLKYCNNALNGKGEMLKGEIEDMVKKLESIVKKILDKFEIKLFSELFAENKEEKYQDPLSI